MKKIIFLLMSLFSLAVSADDNINGGFVVAPMLADGYAAYGDCLAPKEVENGEASYVTGTCVTIISAQTTTDIKGINATEDKPYYGLLGISLKVYRSACLYSLDGRQICCMNPDTQIGIDALPDMFIIKFKDGTVYKLQK